MTSIPHIAPTNLRYPPERFIQKSIGQAWLDKLAQAYPHERYTRSRSDSFSAAECNHYASRILDAKRAGHDLDQALQDLLVPSEFHWTWRECLKPELEPYLAAAGAGTRTKTWLEEIRYEWEERAADADTSTTTDLFSSWDTCEILFALTKTPSLEDNLIYSNKTWSEPAELSITPSLQFALTQIGYTVTQFRSIAANRHQAYETLRPMRPRRPPIISPEQLCEVIDNACSSMFNFYLFAIVPLPDVVAIDLTRPITISPCWLATMNPMSGTFHDVPCNNPVTVHPGDGTLISGYDVAYSPDNICGLHRPHYHARMTNPEPTQ